MGAHCWGGPIIGGGSGPYGDLLTPTLVPGVTNVRAIAGGTYHSCALLIDGSEKCWGHNDFGQLGNPAAPSDGTTRPPIAVQGLTGATAITAGNLHSCALLAGGTAKCWGANPNGQVGNGSASPHPVTTPVAVQGLAGATAISAGGWGGGYSGADAPGHSCALLPTGTVKCWGLNAYGQLGDSTTTDRFVPTLVQGL